MTSRKGEGGFLDRMITHQGLVLVLPVGLVLLVEPLVFKWIQVSVMLGEASPGTALASWAPDAVVAIGLTLLFAVLLSVMKGLPRIVLTTLYFLIAAIVLFMDASSHGYFMATGSHLSLSSLQVWAEHMDETNTVIAGEAMTWKLPLAIGQLVIVLLLAVVPVLPKLRARLWRREVPGRKKIFIFAGILVAGLVGALLVPPPAGKAMSLARCVPLSMLVEMASTSSEDEHGELTESDRLATILEFEEEPGAPRPNVVLIIFESLNWKSSDVYTEGRGTTPFLQSIAPKSAVIQNHYTVVPHTSKAIMPILCGMYPYMGNKRKESTANVLPRRCMAHVLRSQGYATAFYQPAMDFENRSRLVKNMGFENFSGKNDLPGEGFEKISYFGMEDKAMLDPSMSWVDSVKGGPFFLTYLTLATHHNYVTPQSFESVDFPEEDPDQRNYLNAIRYVDDFIREVYEGFEKRGLLDDTVFIVVGDHGEAFAEHGRRQHDLIMWEEGLRCTSLIHSPGGLVEAGEIEGIRSHLDLVPTVCDLLGLELKEGDEGEGFVGRSLLEPPEPDRKLLHSCWFNRQCLALREGPVKTIYHYKHQPMEVYNNSVDEFDETNLSGEKPYDQVFLDARKKEMLDWRKKVNLQYNDWEKDLSEGKVTLVEPKISKKMGAVFGDSIELVGYELFPSSAIAGQDLEVKYVFKSLKKVESAVKLFVHVDKSRGHINADHVPVSGTHPVKKWKPGEYIVDEHVIHIPGDWPDKTARLLVGFWDTKSKKRLEVTGEGVHLDDGRVLVSDIPVKRRSRVKGITGEALREKVSSWVGTEEPEFEQRRGIVFGDMVELVGVTMTRTDVKLAGTVEMTYVFKALRDIPARWRLSVRLNHEEGKKGIRGDHVPIGGLYPLSMWRAGEYVVDKHMVHVDMYKSKVGVHKVWLGFRDGKRYVAGVGEGEFDEKGRVYLGDVTINPKTEKQ